jgi:hypothetical protein
MSRSLVIGLAALVALFSAAIYLMILVNKPVAVAEVSVTGSRPKSPGVKAPVIAPNSEAGATGRVETSGIKKPTTAETPSSPAAAAPSGDDEDDSPKIDVMALPDSDPKLTTPAALDEANRAYDRSDYDQAKSIAVKLLRKNPGSVRLMRIVVSSSCMMGESSSAVAQMYRGLPEADRAQMKLRCDRYGVTFPDAAK